MEITEIFRNKQQAKKQQFYIMKLVNVPLSTLEWNLSVEYLFQETEKAKND